MKWVNDIHFNGKKIAGVLPRAQIKGEDVYLTIGIGVNIGIIPQGFEAQATCLNQILEKPVEISEFFDRLSKHLLENLTRLSQEGFSYLRSLIEPNLEFLQEPVAIWNVELSEVLYNGTFIRMNDMGHAVLLKDDGTEFTVYDGRMRKQWFKY